MAENELTVIRADGGTRTLRSRDLGGNIQAQVALVGEAPEVYPNTAGATSRYTVDSSPAVALDPPDAGCHYARLRVYETAGPQSATRRLYFRQDGVNPTADGVNASGYLLHGEMILIRLTDMTLFRMIADAGDNGVYQVYVEWLNLRSS